MIKLVFSTAQGHTTWYVASSDQSCKHTTPNCHQLPFYTGNVTEYFKSDTTFIFLRGNHQLILLLPQIISNVRNLTLTGDDDQYSEIPTIKCVNDGFGLEFMNSLSVIVNTLIIRNCGPSIYNSVITFTNVRMVKLTKVIVQETKGIGINLVRAADVMILNSSFASNGLGITNCSSAFMKWCLSVHITSSGHKRVYYNITDTVFFGNYEQIGGGLHIYTSRTWSSFVFIKRCQFLRITGYSASGASIWISDFEKVAIVHITDSYFFNNTGIGDTSSRNLQDGSALKVLITQSKSVINRYMMSQNEIKVSHSLFYYNRARKCAGTGIKFNDINNQGRIILQNNKLLENVAETNGGGLCIILFGRSQIKINISVLQSVFEQNSAHQGAALLLEIQRSNNRSYHLVHLADCIFRSNIIHFIPSLILTNEGSVVKVTLKIALCNTVVVNNCSFVNNLFGPSLYFNADEGYDHLIVQVIKCVFDKNHGSGIFSSGIATRLTNAFKSIQISYCLFLNGYGGVIFIVEELTSLNKHAFPKISLKNVTVQSWKSLISAVTFKCNNQMTIVAMSNVTLLNNKGTGVSAMNCVLKFHGYNVIANNTASNFGGGIVVNGIGYAITSTDGVVVFKNNKASFGGALYSLNHMSTNYVKSWCTFLGLNAVFINNTAKVAGDNLYGGIITDCTLHGRYIFTPPTDCKNISRSLLQTNSSISSIPFSVFLCNLNNTIQYSTSNISVLVYPGQNFTLSLITGGYCNGSSPGKLKFSSSPGMKIVTDIQNQQTSTTCKDMSYRPLVSSADVVKGKIIISVGELDDRYAKPLEVNIIVLPCPYGMQIKSGICDCDNIIAKKMKSVTCNIYNLPNPITKLAQDNSWIGYDKQSKCIVIAYECPFDYCATGSDVSFNLNDSTDLQCRDRRTGTLCGQCQQGLSLMLGSNVCSKCSNAYLFIVIVSIMIAGILLVVLLIMLNLTVSIGSINGLLFYANIVKLNKAVFFPDRSIPVISQLISWLNLDLGLEVCFVEGLNGYWKI